MVRAKRRGWSLTLAVATLAGLSACSSLAEVFDRGPETSLDQVDDLLGQVERTHLECEVSREVCLDLLDALHGLAAPEFHGDAIEAHEQLLVRLETSQEQAESLAESLDDLAGSASVVRERWDADLEAFISPRMREQSALRLEATNALYADVHHALEAAVAFYDLYNLGLADHALYLGNDLNRTSVAAIEGEMRALTTLAAELDARLLRAMAACETYVRETALRGQLDETESPDRIDDLAVVQVAEPEGLRLASK